MGYITYFIASLKNFDNFSFGVENATYIQSTREFSTLNHISHFTQEYQTTKIDTVLLTSTQAYLGEVKN